MQQSPTTRETVSMRRVETNTERNFWCRLQPALAQQGDGGHRFGGLCCWRCLLGAGIDEWCAAAAERLASSRS